MEPAESILRELLLFRDALLLGAAAMAVYDVIRIFRRIVWHGIFWISFEDVLYWIILGIAVFLLLYYQNNGRIRAYILGAAVLGAVIYYQLLGRFIIRGASKLIPKLKKRLKKLWKAVTIKTDKKK